jgi:predicted Zn-dependent protease with MMP-like domain
MRWRYGAAARRHAGVPNCVPAARRAPASVAAAVYDTVMSVEADIHAAARLLAEGDARAAVERLRAVVSADGLAPGLEADARYLLGRALGACGDRDGMALEWGRVLGLDAVAARPRAVLSAEEFESVAQAALDELPQALLDGLNGVAILIEDRPSPEMVADGLDPRLLGLYHGVPLNRRSASFGAPYADTIHLFRANLERVFATRDALVAHIRVTVLHETAHFFGYSEVQLRSMGLA